MAGFTCKNCGFDLSLRIDLIAKAMKNDYEDGVFPKDVSVDGCCDECKTSFHYSGKMFSKFLETKAAEGIISSRTDNFLIFEFDIGQENLEQVRTTMRKGSPEELQSLLTKLIADGRPDKD